MSGGGIVERIREGCRELEAQGVVPHLGYEAAAEIERQAAEIERLRALLPLAYDAGFRASSDGWNGEYPDNAMEAPEYTAPKAAALAALGKPLHAAQALPATPAAPGAPERAGGLPARACGMCCPDAYACLQAGCQLERRFSAMVRGGDGVPRHPSPEGTP